MLTHLRRAVVLTFALLVVCGLAYPLAGLAVAQGAFHAQANGSVVDHGAASSLIGQPWTTNGKIDPKWFQGRPDAFNPLWLNGTPGTSGAASLGPRSSALVSAVQALVAAWHAVGVNPTADLVTTSGSGLDPDISRAGAMVQVAMVARARGLPVRVVHALVAAHVHGAQFGFLGAPYVNVLDLNEALAVYASSHPTAR